MGLLRPVNHFSGVQRSKNKWQWNAMPFQAVLAFYLVTALCQLPKVSGCVFPAFVQTNGSNHIWKGRIMEQYTSSSMTYKFNVRTMTAESTDTNLKDFTRICVQSYGADKYLVAHEEGGQSGGRYTCIQILQRGTGLIQFKVAPLSKRLDRSLCDDQNLVLDDWVLIDESRIKGSSETCALHGGYEMAVYDNRMHQGVCDGNKGETRIESECEHGEGMTFYFRQTTCVPDGMYMYAEQRVICMANWETEGWTFILMKHDTRDYMWIMRIPTEVITNSMQSFTAYMFKDLVAEMSDIVKTTDNYLKLSMTQSLHQVVGKLCIDDYEICSVLQDPCRYSDAMKLTCSKTCGVCNVTNPRLCTFKHDLQGRWYDAVDSSRGAVVVNASSLSIDNKHNYQCVDWSNFAHSPNDSRHNIGDEKTMVVTYTNGCRARYACGRFVQNSPAAFFFQVSNTRRWPLITMANEKISCEKFEYKHDSDVEGPKIRYRSKHLKMLVPQEYTNTITCDLEEFWLFDVVFKDDVRCFGDILQAQNGTRDNLKFSLNEDCPSQQLKDTYKCVEFSNFSPNHDKLLVTRNEDEPGRVYCWIFPQRHRNVFHLVEASQCNEISKRRIRRGRLRPLATFSKRKKKIVYTPSVLTGEKVLNDTIKIVEIESDTSTAETVDVTYSIRNVKTKNVTSSEPGEGGSSPSPLVVAAVVITLMIFQIPFMCKCANC